MNKTNLLNIWLILASLFFGSKMLGQTLNCRELKDGMSERYWMVQAVGIRYLADGVVQGVGTVTLYNWMGPSLSWPDNNIRLSIEKNESGSGYFLQYKLKMKSDETLKIQIPLEEAMAKKESSIVNTEISNDGKKESIKLQCSVVGMENGNKFKTLVPESELTILERLQKNIGMNSIDISKIESCNEPAESKCEEYKIESSIFCATPASCTIVNARGAMVKAQLNLFCKKRRFSESLLDCAEDKTISTKEALINLQKSDSSKKKLDVEKKKVSGGVR